MSSSTTKSNSKRKDKRTLILDAAAKQLNLYGVSHTSFNQVAQSTGLSRNALYYYVKDPKDLVFQCYRHSCTKMIEALQQACESHENALDIIDGFIDGVLGKGMPEIAALSEVALLQPDQHQTIVDMKSDLWRRLAGVIEQGMRRGVIRSCHTDLVARAIIGLIDWMSTVQRWREAERFSDGELVDVMKSILRLGVAQDRAAPIEYVPFDLSPPVLPMRDAFDADALTAIRREALSAAASWQFNLKGIDSTTLEEIAASLGITRKVLYQHARDKSELVIQCYRRAFRFHEDLAVRARNLKGTRIDAITSNTHASAEASLREDISPFAQLTGHESWPAAEREELQAISRHVIKQAVDVYRQGQLEGSVRNIDPVALIMIVPGFSNWLPKWYALLDREERDVTPAEMAKLFRLGLCAI